MDWKKRVSGGFGGSFCHEDFNSNEEKSQTTILKNKKKRGNIRWDWLHVTMAKSQHGGGWGGGRESKRHFGEWNPKNQRAGLGGK